MNDLVSRPLEEVLNDLPAMCMLADLATGETIAVKRGEVGFWPMAHVEDPEAWNAERGITAAQAEAMRMGSHFGFDVPGADPMNCMRVEGERS